MKPLALIVVTTLIAACQSPPMPKEPAVSLTVEQENQLLDQMNIVGRGKNLVFVHGCDSRSAGLVFSRKIVLEVIRQYPDASLSRKLKSICSFSK